jgi:hypothetical protein
MPHARLTRRIDALTQAIPIPVFTHEWDIRRLSDADLEALLPLATRLDREGPDVRWQPDEVLLLEHAWIVATTERREETSCRR